MLKVFPSPSRPDELELSVVIPCLNEADSLGICVTKALRAMQGAHIRGEVIVADNGSTDGSIEIAESLGARVVHVTQKGYGNALAGGIRAARGRYVLMGDADDSYDFRELPRFVEEIRKGFDLVQGCRLPRGGGRIMPGAMPLLHRWWGNPMFSWMVRKLFWAPIHDVYCGMRVFTHELFDRLDLRSPGMEFATEMIIRASLFGARISEIPITLHPDARTSHPPHLRTFRDGWRTLRFFMLYSPKALFAVPGLVLIALGLVGYALALPGVTLFGATFDAHTLLFASLALIVGFQAGCMAVFAKVFAARERLLPDDRRIVRLLDGFRIETGLITGGAVAGAGGLLLAIAAGQWFLGGFGRLDYATTMRLVVPGVTVCALGMQAMFGSCMLALFQMRREAVASAAASEPVAVRKAA